MMMGLFLVSFGVDGQSGRALLVVASFVSVYLLVRYWHGLSGHKAIVRNSLVGLRAASLLLVTCALAGLSVEYESRARSRLLLKSVFGEDPIIAQKAIDALEGNDFEVVRANSEAEILDQDIPYAAAILLTDGAASSVEARRAVETASTIVGGAPVFVVTNLKSQSEEASVTLERVAIVGRASRGVTLAVRCFVRGRGMQGRESLVTISDDAKVQTAARVVWTTNDERQIVTLSIVPKISGWIDYTAKVEAAGRERAEMLARPFTLHVEERRLRVLFFEGEPTWEAKFIRRALDKAGLFDVDYFARVSRAAVAGVSEAEQEGSAEDRSADKEVAQEGGTPEAKLRAVLQSPARLNNYDCVIVGASPDGLLSASEAARLSEWVARRGGGLIILGGNSFQGSIAAPGGKLNSLVPAQINSQSFQSAQSQEMGRGRPLEAEKTRSTTLLTPTESGASGALAGYLKAIEESEAKAFGLTGQGLRLGALRAGASVLAVTGHAAGANGTSEQGSAQIAAMRYGEGRSLVFAPADSWRIRTSASASADDAAGPFGALWQGLVLWTAEGARSPVEIVLSADSPLEGSTVMAELRVRDAMFAPLRIEKISARLQPLTENMEESAPAAAATLPQEVAFKPDWADASVWRAGLASPPNGRYILEVDYVAQGRSASVEKQFSVVAARPFAEGSSLDTLRRVSREHRGDLMDADSLDALAKRLTATSKGEPEQRRWELRAWWPLALLLPLLLSTEWFARRWWKLD